MSKKKGSTIIIEGNFDEFYQKNFRDQLEADLFSDPNNNGGFLKPADGKRMKVVNWKKVVKI